MKLCKFNVGMLMGFLLASWLVFGDANAEPQAATPADNSAKRYHAVDPAQVKVQGEIGRRIELTIHANLLKLDVDNQLLKAFRERQGWESDKGAFASYVGLGKIIDSAVSFARYTKDPEVIQWKDRLIKELLATQLEDGYMGIFPPKDRVFKLWDLHEMVYNIFALVNNYRCFHNQQSLDAARRIADYILKNRKSTDKKLSTVGKLNTERAMIALSQATGDRRYRDYAVDGMNLRNWRASIRGHVYTFMNICLAQLDLYLERPEEGLLVQSHKVVDYLTKNDGLMITGTSSLKEVFHNNQETRGNLGESCVTAYLIRLMHYLLQIEGKSQYGDIMERAIFNSLFQAQSPDGRRLRYYNCIDGPRVYWNRDTFCCPGNWRRIVAELPEMIYYRSANGGLLVNLYTASSAELRLDGGLSVRLRQATDYPNSGKIALTIEPSKPAEFPVTLRIPRWSKTAAVSINGQSVADPVNSGQWFTIRRRWNSGDVITLEMPMEPRLVRGRKMQTGKAAVMRGPLVFCLAPSRQTERLTAYTGEAKNPAAVQQAVAETLKQLKFDWTSIADPVADKSVRPDGLALEVRAWGPKSDRNKPADLTLLLTEFIDPAGEMTYLPLDDPKRGVEDELIVAP
jgi:uncharacterized protein